MGSPTCETLSHGETHSIYGVWTSWLVANNLSEPQRSYALSAIDRAINFWKGKRVPRPIPPRAPWLLSPTWTKDLRQLMTSHVATIQPHIVTFQHPSTAVVFTKNPSVMDSLCNQKEYATRWADGKTPTCTCQTFQRYLPSTGSPSSQDHLHLDGDALTFPIAPLTSIATGSLQNMIFPPNKEIYKSLSRRPSDGTKRTPSLQYHFDTLELCGPPLGHFTTNTSTNTSPTKTLCDSINYSTTRTKEPPHYVCIAHACTSNASRTPSPTPTFSAAWTSLRHI